MPRHSDTEVKVLVEHLAGSALAGTTGVLSGPRIEIGRSSSAAVRFDPRRDVEVSGHHAELLVRNGELWLRDLDSTNGTFVDGEPVDREVRLRPGSVVSLGEAGPTFRARLEGAGERGGQAEEDSEPPLRRERRPEPEPRSREPERRPERHREPAPRAGRREERIDDDAEAPGQKVGIGQHTLIRAISAATADERRRTTLRLSLVAGGFLVVSLVVWALVSSDTDELERQTRLLANRVEASELRARRLQERSEAKVETAMSEYRKHLEDLGSKITDREARVATLLTELEKRRQSIDSIKRDAQLADEQRDKIVARLEAKAREIQLKLDEVENVNQRDAGQRWQAANSRMERCMFFIVTGDSVATAFSIRHDGVLATNAHVAKAAERPGTHVAVQNVTGLMFKITAALSHKDYRGVQSPDVGLMRIDTRGMRMPEAELATVEELRTLVPGTQLATFGYPGELSNAHLQGIRDPIRRGELANTRARGVVATFKFGNISRITDYGLRRSTFDLSHFIQHSAALTGGTSGSPMYLANGHVVALNNADLSHQVTTKSGKTHRMATGGLLSFAIRVDELKDLVRESGW